METSLSTHELRKSEKVYQDETQKKRLSYKSQMRDHFQGILFKMLVQFF